MTPLDLSKGTENQVDVSSHVCTTENPEVAEEDKENEEATPENDKTVVRSSQSTSDNACSSLQVERTGSIEDVTNESNDDISKLMDELSSLKKEVNSYKELNNELNKSLDYANSLLREEKKWNLRLSSERSMSPISSPTTSERRQLVDETTVDDAFVLETISETNSGEKGVAEPRRLSFERRRSEELKNIPGRLQSPDEGRPKRPPPMERRNSIADEEIVRRRRVYGQRKASMSLDEMLDLFGCHTNLPSSNNVSKESSPTLSRPQSSAKTLSFEVSKNGVPLHSQKEF